MKISERLNKINILKNIEKILQQKQLELAQIEQKICKKKSELYAVSNKLESLETEIKELEDFINSNFNQQFKECDYMVDITNCYIIEFNGKKYITLRSYDREETDLYTLATGRFIVDTYVYYDVLHIVNKKYKLKKITEYIHGHDYYSNRITGKKPYYEQHILSVYPELIVYADNMVPNTHLKKIYYELNELGSKKLINK